MKQILDLKYRQEERKQLQEFLAKTTDEPLPAEQENWIPIQSLLSENHSLALFGLRDETGFPAKNADGSVIQAATYPASAICYRLDGQPRTATYGTLVPENAQIEYVRRSNPALPGSGDPNRPPSSTSGGGGDDFPMYIPSVSGGMY